MSGRIRTLKPEWLEDEKLAASSDSARILSVALILCADDHGNGRAHPLYLASRVWPYSEPHETLMKIARGLAELEQAGYVAFYEAGNQRYFHIRNWKRHQKVQHPGAPRVPLPSEGAPAEPPSLLLLPSRAPPETLTPDLRSPISDHDHTRARAHESEGPQNGASRDLAVRVFKRFRDHYLRRRAGAVDDYQGLDANRNHFESIGRAAASQSCGFDKALERALKNFFASEEAFVVKKDFAPWILAKSFGQYFAPADAESGSTAQPDEYDRLQAELEVAQQKGDHDRVAQLREALRALARKAASP